MKANTNERTNQTKHTPAPWQVGKYRDHKGRLTIFNDQQIVVAILDEGTKQEDANILASAPELFELAKRMADENFLDFDAFRQECIKVVAKAEGR